MPEPDRRREWIGILEVPSRGLISGRTCPLLGGLCIRDIEVPRNKSLGAAEGYVSFERAQLTAVINFYLDRRPRSRAA
jgi:hypothetical protein